jgi:BirA family transcriptional regulator, biotin operon repressor / biotin---[acetyl-CoA-carboxylase] ligase
MPVDATLAGHTPVALAVLLGVPRVALFEEVESTMDVAHQLASEGAAPGTIVLAHAQRAGRGRAGRRWQSVFGAGLWLTMIERPNDPGALDVLSLRVGLRVARALDRFAGAAVGLKWPNDLHLHGRKLGGILVESRWRDNRPDWAAIGVGVNYVTPPDGAAAALGMNVDRIALLGEVVPAVRAAAAARGHLSERELAEYAERDIAAGQACRAPRAGRVAGVAANGALLVVTGAGVERCRDGSLVLEEDPA